MIMKMNLLRASLLSFAFLLVSLVISSCGNSSEQEAALEKARQDSIAEAQSKMEQAKEEARRRAAEDSTQQVEAAQATE
jgi:cellobiose-specific phosphotransferase system component IIA